MSLVSKKEADLLLSNFCHLPRDLQLNIINRIAEFTREDVTYVFPSSSTDSKNVFPDLMELYVAIKERGNGKLSTGLQKYQVPILGNEMTFIGDDINAYRKQLIDPKMNVPDSVGRFHALPFTLASVKEILLTYGSISFSIYFFSDRIDAFGSLVRDFLLRYDQYMAWVNSKKDERYRHDANFMQQLNVLMDKDAPIEQKVTAAYNIFTWAGIEITEELTRTCEPWVTMRADSDGLAMIEDIIADAYANKVDPFRNPVCAGVNASIEAEPEYDVEITEEDWLAEVVTTDLAAKALTAYNKSTDYNALIKVRDTMINFTIDHEMLAQHIHQYRGRHEIHLIPVTPAPENGKVSWRYVLEDQMKKLYLLFSNTSKNSEIYGLHVDQKDPSKMELIVIEKDKHNRYTFTG